MRFTSLVFFGISLPVLAACTPSTVVPIAGLSLTAKTVVVVPSLPDYLIVDTRGFTVFGNYLDTPSITGWNLDQLVYNTSATVLSARYSVSELVPKDVLVDYQSRMTSALDSDDGVAKLLETGVTVAQPPDLYIVFCVSARSHPYVDAPNTPAYMQDIGISEALPPWGLPSLPPVMHSFLEMTVIDGKTMKVIYDTPLIMPPGSNVTVGALISHDDPYPEKELKHFQWHDKWADMAPNQREKVKSGIENLLTPAVAYTVQNAVMQ